MIVERILLLSAVTLLILVLITFSKRLQLKKVKSAASNIPATNQHRRKFQLIYFWSTQCNACRTTQSPAIKNIIQTVGKETVIVRDFNIAESIEQAKKWGVKTVPSTYILDANGNVLHMNNGLVSEKVLLKQLA